MSYYFSTKVKGNFDDIVKKTTEALKKEGFGVLTDIDVSATLKKSLMKILENIAFWELVIHPLHSRLYRLKIRSELCCPAT